MYAKVFAQIYDGTLCTKGPWQALVTFQQLLVLADQDGHVDMTAAAISRRTTIPLEIISLGIEELLKDDPESRTPTENGRRILPLCEGRNWGWAIVNYKHYRALKREEERRNYHREYWHKRKDKLNTKLNNSTKSTEHNTLNENQPIAEAEAEAKAKESKTLSSSDDIARKKLNGTFEIAKELLEFLNKKTGKGFRPVLANLEPISARLKEGFSPQDIKTVIARKCMEWGKDDVMSKYLRPATLFNRSKFAQYNGECVTEE